MNQILVTEKLYITPEIKRKKRMYKIRFFLSVHIIYMQKMIEIRAKKWRMQY